MDGTDLDPDLDANTGNCIISLLTKAQALPHLGQACFFVSSGGFSGAIKAEGVLYER